MTGHSIQLWFVSACAGLALIAPGISEACAVCMTGREDETRVAFELMTGFMTLTPFILVGGVLWWLRGRLKDLEARHDQAREAAFDADPGRGPHGLG